MAMLKLDWALVDKKVNELYPRFKKGMKYDEAEAELAAQGLDSDHIKAVIRKMDQKIIKYRHGGDSTVIMLIAAISVLALSIIMVLMFSKNYFIVSVGIFSSFFMFIKVFNDWIKERGN